MRRRGAGRTVGSTTRPTQKEERYGGGDDYGEPRRFTGDLRALPGADRPRQARGWHRPHRRSEPEWRLARDRTLGVRGGSRPILGGTPAARRRGDRRTGSSTAPVLAGPQLPDARDRRRAGSSGTGSFRGRGRPHRMTTLHRDEPPAAPAGHAPRERMLAGLAVTER